MTTNADAARNATVNADRAAAEQVSAILRSDGPLYPSRIGVYCDACGTTVEGEYVVSAEQTRGERLNVAREHMRAAGWTCDEGGDFCPLCAGEESTRRVLVEVAAERTRQDTKWGEQNHPDGTGEPHAGLVAGIAKAACQRAAELGDTSWTLIMMEEVYEAFAESDPARLRAELVQVAAVAVAWVEAIDRRTAAAAQQFPEVGQTWAYRPVYGTRTVTITDVSADDEGTVVTYEWGDGTCGSACPMDVFLRRYQPAEGGEGQ